MCMGRAIAAQKLKVRHPNGFQAIDNMQYPLYPLGDSTALIRLDIKTKHYHRRIVLRTWLFCARNNPQALITE